MLLLRINMVHTIVRITEVIISTYFKLPHWRKNHSVDDVLYMCNMHDTCFPKSPITCRICVIFCVLSLSQYEIYIRAVMKPSCYLS